MSQLTHLHCMNTKDSSFCSSRSKNDGTNWKNYAFQTTRGHHHTVTNWLDFNCLRNSSSSSGWRHSAQSSFKQCVYHGWFAQTSRTWWWKKKIETKEDWRLWTTFWSIFENSACKLHTISSCYNCIQLIAQWNLDTGTCTCNKGSRDWQNMFIITRFHCIQSDTKKMNIMYWNLPTTIRLNSNPRLRDFLRICSCTVSNPT